MRFDKLIARFSGADRDTRLEAMLDASRTLPEVPERLRSRMSGLQVPECQTPVFLWVEPEDGRLRFHAEVPRDSPTVRGYVSLLIRTLDGATPAEVEQVPDDLLDRLKLVETLGMIRIQGLTAVLRHLKRAARTPS
ncbi:MAG TPA: SufE family protein [Gemmatimonadales bacterium]